MFNEADLYEYSYVTNFLSDGVSYALFFFLRQKKKNHGYI